MNRLLLLLFLFLLMLLLLSLTLLLQLLFFFCFVLAQPSPLLRNIAGKVVALAGIGKLVASPS